MLFVILLSSLHVRATPRYLIGYLQSAKTDIIWTYLIQSEMMKSWDQCFQIFTLECYDVRQHETILII